MLHQGLFRRPRLNPRPWLSPEFRIASVATSVHRASARPAVAPPIACRKVGSSTAPKASRASLIPATRRPEAWISGLVRPRPVPHFSRMPCRSARKFPVLEPWPCRPDTGTWRAASSQSAQRSPLPPRPCRQRGPAPHRFPNSRPSLPTAYSEAIAVPMNTAAAVPPPTPAATRTRIPLPACPNRQAVLLIDSVVGHLARVPPAHSARQAGHHQGRERQGAGVQIGAGLRGRRAFNNALVASCTAPDTAP